MKIEPQTLEDIFGPPVSVYTRAQAIEDGNLVDISEATDDAGANLCQQAGIKWPVALTRACYEAVIAVGGT